MKLLTANRLSDGLTIWYTPSGWVEDAAHAARLDDAEAEALQKTWAARETEVVGAYLIPLKDDGAPVQREHVREFVRANGPTIGATADALARRFQRADIFKD
jgi:hypothetical protein